MPSLIREVSIRHSRGKTEKVKEVWTEDFKKLGDFREEEELIWIEYLVPWRADTPAPRG